MRFCVPLSSSYVSPSLLGCIYDIFVPVSLMLLTSSSGLDSYRSRKMPGSGSTFKRPCPFLVFFKLSYFLADLFENCHKECDLEIEICSL